MVQNSCRPSKLNLFLLLVILLFTTGMVSGQSSDNDGNTQLKVIQLSPDAEPMNIFIDGEKVGNNLEFGDLVGLDLETGRHEIRAVSTNTEVTRTVNLEQNRPYMLTINNRAISPETTLLSQNTTPPPQNQAKVRIAHFSPDLLAINVDVQNGNTFSTRDLSYLETEDYTTVSPGNYTVNVREPTAGGTRFNRQVRIRSNRTYTVFIAGLENGANGQNLRVIPVSERLEIPAENGENGGNGDNGNGENGNGENGEETNGEDGIQKDFSLVCRLEETDS